MGSGNGFAHLRVDGVVLGRWWRWQWQRRVCVLKWRGRCSCPKGFGGGNVDHCSLIDSRRQVKRVWDCTNNYFL